MTKIRLTVSEYDRRRFRSNVRKIIQKDLGYIFKPVGKKFLEMDSELVPNIKAFEKYMRKFIGSRGHVDFELV